MGRTYRVPCQLVVIKHIAVLGEAMWDFFAATVPLELTRACSSRTVAPAGELAIQTSFSSGDGGSSSPGIS